MSEEESPDLTKSWVFVDPEKPPETSGVEDVDDANEPHVDSDTDSISVISESGCSYKTDEDDFVPAATMESEEPCGDNPEDKPSEAEMVSSEIEDKSVEPEITEITPHETKLIEPIKTNPQNDRTGIEKILYFATSAACAVILLGFSVAVQQYFYQSSNVNTFKADFAPSQTVKTREIQIGDSRKLYIRKRTQSKFEQPQDSIIKLEPDNNFHDKIKRPNIQTENNDLRVEDVKSNYKPNKNKSPAAKFNKENRDGTDKRAENDKYKKKNQRSYADEKTKHYDENRPNDETYTKRMKELKRKETYLRQKEKFLIEKEHDLMRKEIKLNKEHQNYGKNKYEKKIYYKKDKKHKQSEENDDDSKEKRDKFKKNKKYMNENNNPKNNKKYKNKEEKKLKYVQNQPKIVDNEPHKKRNISGQWYINLHKARNNIRQKEHASDWVFDRAHLRSLKRNKAHWYFQWMVDRARLRVK